MIWSEEGDGGIVGAYGDQLYLSKAFAPIEKRMLKNSKVTQCCNTIMWEVVTFILLIQSTRRQYSSANEFKNLSVLAVTRDVILIFVYF